MLKNKSLGLLFLFFLLASFLILSKSLQKQTPKKADNPNKNTVETSLFPSQTAINFYSNYLNYKGDLMSESAYVNSEYLSEDLKIKLKKEISKKPVLNPILCLNQKPDQITVSSATVSSGLAEVLITNTYLSKKYSHILKLKLSGNKYVISDIICK